MANLPETEDFADGTYQIETSDRVLGGPGGIANKQGEQLGNRTAWLRAAIAKIIDGTTAVGKATQLAAARTLKFKGAVSGSGSYDGTGDTEIALTLVDTGVAAGSYTKVTINVKGLVTGASNPTTLAGYGITDAYTNAQVDTALLGKASKATTLAGYGITDVYTKSQVDTALLAKAAKATTLSGYGITDAYTSAQVDTALLAKAAKATTLSGYGITDGITAAQVNAGLAQKWDLATYPPAQYIKMGQLIPSGSNPVFQSTGFGAIAAILGGGGSLQVSGGDAPSSAVMCFHRPGSYGVMFGLDTDNQLKLGGWSAGAVAHTIWHSGNRPKDTALLAASGWSKNADTGEIKQWVEVAVDDISSFKLTPVSWPFQFPNGFLNAQITLRIPMAGNIGCVSVASYHSATTSGCTIRVEEYASVLQAGMVAIVEARGY